MTQSSFQGVSSSERPSPLAIPRRLWGISLMLAGIGWGLAALRHFLLQSNAYDLGLFDQWAWLVSQGLPPISSMEQVHLLADHGAWGFYAAGGLYALAPSVQWLLASQALMLSLTALPLWRLATQAQLPRQLCWLVCLLWWLQPVVFNTNLFDMHPEVWVMPAFALALWAERAGKPRLWFALLVVMLSCRDGLVLITAGMACELAWRQRWGWSAAAAALSAGWLLMLSRWLYPWLRDGEGPKAAGRMFGHLSGGLGSALAAIDWTGGAMYLLLLCLPCGLFWRRRSLPLLLIGLPLVLVNLLSASPSYRTLIHHYSLPLAVVAVTAAIDGLAAAQRGGQSLGRRARAWLLGWTVLCWLALAKPWFFTGPYLQRLAWRGDVDAAISRIQASDGVLTTSYLVPHLSERPTVAFPKKSFDASLPSSDFTALLLNPLDPGWGSASKVQRRLLNQARRNGWECQRWPSGLELCRSPGAAQQLRPGNATPRNRRAAPAATADAESNSADAAPA